MPFLGSGVVYPHLTPPQSLQTDRPWDRTCRGPLGGDLESERSVDRLRLGLFDPQLCGCNPSWLQARDCLAARGKSLPWGQSALFRNRMPV